MPEPGSHKVGGFKFFGKDSCNMFTPGTSETVGFNDVGTGIYIAKPGMKDFPLSLADRIALRKD